jgi:ATP-binding cassette subfamily C protein LapB
MRRAARPDMASACFQPMREFGSVREFFTASTISTNGPSLHCIFSTCASIGSNVVAVGVFVGGVLMGAAILLSAEKNDLP